MSRASIRQRGFCCMPSGSRRLPSSSKTSASPSSARTISFWKSCAAASWSRSRADFLAVGEKYFRFLHQMYDFETGKMVATCDSVAVQASLESGKSIPLTAALQEKAKRYLVTSNVPLDSRWGERSCFSVLYQCTLERALIRGARRKARISSEACPNASRTARNATMPRLLRANVGKRQATQLRRNPLWLDATGSSCGISQESLENFIRQQAAARSQAEADRRSLQQASSTSS